MPFNRGFSPGGSSDLKRFGVREGFWILGLVAFWAALFHREIFQGQTFVIMDDTRVFYPLWKWMGGVFGEGKIPLWNDQAGMGSPFWADPENDGAYLPLRALYFLWGPLAAFTQSILIHSLFGILGFWFLARYRGFSPGASFLGSLVFGFSTLPFSLTWDPTMLFAFSWIPWVFWSGFLLRNRAKGSLLFFSLSVAMQLSSGYPLYGYLTLIALTSELLLESRGNEGPRAVSGGNWKWLLAYGESLVLALVFNLVWLIPFLEFKGLSNIQKRLEMPASVPWGGLATWLNPFFLGHPFHSAGGSVFPWLTCYFMGLPVVVLVLYGFFTGSLRKTTGYLFFLWLVLSLGESAIVGGWLKLIFPFYHWVARSGYWISLVTFFGARLSMETAEALYKNHSTRNLFTLAWWFGVAAAAAAALWLGVPPDLPSFWLSVFLMGLVGIKWKGFFRCGPLLLPLALVFSLGPVLESLHFSMPGSYYIEKPAWCEAVRKPGRIFHSPLLAEGMDRVTGNGIADAYLKMKEVLLPNWPLNFGFEEAFYFNTIFFQPSLDWCYSYIRYSPVISRKIMDYLNVRYLVGNQRFAGFRTVGQAPGGIPISENERVMPKWVSVQNARLEKDWPADILETGGDSFDFRKDCFIADPTKAGAYSVRFPVEVARDGGRLELTAPGSGKSLLVSSEMNYPGWKAWVEGEPRALETVNHSFRGVALKSSEKEVVLRFSPTSFRLGCFLSLLACSVWTLLALGLGFPAIGRRHARV